jgi:hypothetical protein
MSTNNVGRVLVSLLVVCGFLIVTYMFITEKAAGGTPGETLTLLVGALASNFTSVVSYWIGSSSGSTAKDEQMSKTAEKLAEKVTPAAVAIEAAQAVAPAAAAVAAPPAVDAELDRRGV